MRNGKHRHAAAVDAETGKHTQGMSRCGSQGAWTTDAYNAVTCPLCKRMLAAHAATLKHFNTQPAKSGTKTA